ncbi:MAG: porin family protein [Cytophagales bacterium]|nr:porin family protein [Cytophagales bacterium]
MKFLVLLGCVLVSGLAAAQSYSVGIAGAYGDDIEEPGVNLRAYYNLKNDRICFGPEFTVFRTRSKTVGNEEEEVSLFEVNVNLHYIFELTEKLGVYPLTGVNFSREKVEVGSLEEAEEEWGVNLGLGAHYAVGKFTVFTEYDHLFSELNQNSFLLGVFFTFGKGGEKTME